MNKVHATIAALMGTMGLALPAGAADPPQAYAYDIARFRQVPPALLHYREGPSVDPGFAAPRGLAVAPDGRLAVAGDRAVRLFDPEGRRLGDIVLDGEPGCVAFRPDGSVLAGIGRRIALLKAGEDPAYWNDLGEQAVLTSLAASSNRVAAADAGQRVIWLFANDGALKGRIDGRAGGRRGFIVPSPHLDVVLVRDDLLWTTNPGFQRLEQYRTDGTLLSQWGEASMRIEGFCGCCNPTDFARLPDGSFVTAEKGIPRVKLYSPDGRLRSVVVAPADVEGDPSALDLAADAAGRIFVLDPVRRRIRIFTRKDDAP